MFYSLPFYRFATLATRMEQYIQGQSRDLVDQAYTKFVSFLKLIYDCYSDVIVSNLKFSYFLELVGSSPGCVLLQSAHMTADWHACF